MKKKLSVISVILLLALLAGTAAAELSTNLLIVNTVNPRNGLTTLKTYTDADGMPAVPSDKGYASVRYTYGTGNKVIKEELLDTEGNMIACSAGYDELRREFNEKNQAVRYDYYLKERHVTNSKGYSVMTRVYNEKGKVILETYYDTKGQITLCADGYYAIRRNYDEAGNVTEEIKIDTLEGLQ